MNLLTGRLPQTVIVGGAEYPIRSDFRTSIRFEMLVQNPEIPDTEIMRRSLMLYYPYIPSNLTAAVEKMIWFYSCGKNEPQLEQKKQPDEGEEDNQEDDKEDRLANRPYSFEHDDAYIYAAFMQCYGIDLNRVQNLHWWKFRAMFKALPDDCQFMKIVGYRSMRITSKMSKEQKAYYRRMKTLYALPCSKEETEQSNALIEALKNGGDLTGLI